MQAGWLAQARLNSAALVHPPQIRSRQRILQSGGSGSGLLRGLGQLRRMLTRLGLLMRRHHHVRHPDVLVQPCFRRHLAAGPTGT